MSQGLQYHGQNKDIIPQPCHQSILKKLRDFFARHHQDHVTALRHLGILELRFQRMFLNEEEVDWSQRFWTNISFFEHITTTPAAEIANLLTRLDLEELRLVPPQAFVNSNDRCLQNVHRRCNRLCEAIQESIILREQLKQSVVRLAEVGLISMSLRSSHV